MTQTKSLKHRYLPNSVLELCKNLEMIAIIQQPHTQLTHHDDGDGRFQPFITSEF